MLFENSVIFRCSPTCRSFMNLNKWVRESHALPPAKLLRQNSTGLNACDFRLRSTAFDNTLLDPFCSDVSLPLAAWDIERVSFTSIHSAHAVGECSNFSTLALHLLWIDDSSMPFQLIRFRYSCMKNWVVVEPCSLDTRIQTLCLPFEFVDILGCGGRFWYSFELKPTAVLRRSSTLSKPAFLKISKPSAWPLLLYPPSSTCICITFGLNFPDVFVCVCTTHTHTHTACWVLECEARCTVLVIQHAHKLRTGQWQ